MNSDELHGLLFGRDDRERIVGLDCDTSTSTIHLYRRENGSVTEETAGFTPYVYLDGREIFRRADVDCETVELAGDAGFNLLGRFANCSEYAESLRSMASYYRLHKKDFAHQPYYEVKEFPHQYMLATGATHFLGMEWENVRTLHVWLRLNVSEELANPKIKEHRIVELGLKFGEDSVLLDGGILGEEKLLGKFVEYVQKFDPDVICGHNLYKHILFFLAARAKKSKVPLRLGRGEREVWSERYTMPLAERRLEFPRLRVFGRSLLDTWILAQSYDIFKREMDSYDLPYLAAYLGLRDDEREEADTLEALEETADVATTLVQNYFHLSQMLPYSLEDSVIKGNATKINSLLLREYYAKASAVPYPAEGRVFPGGYTDVRVTGVVRPVINVDIASLYPSLILSHKLFPQGDRLGVFERALRELLTQRLAIKQRLKSLSDSARFAQLDARQGAFKIIINSFYGYLGTARMNFADLDIAEEVTRLGQETVREMARLVEELGGRIVEIDTDGIYLQPPEHIRGAEGYAEFAEKVNEQMPEGISVELGGQYEAMLSYKVKNYALLSPDGELTIKGSGMKSRGLEPFLRRFIEDSIRLILEGRAEKIEPLYEEVKRDLTEGRIPVRKLAKTAILVDSLATYEKKLETTRRSRQAQYEVALRNPDRFKPGDPVSYYIGGDSARVKAYEAAKLLGEYDPEAPDVNIPYYQKRLAETYKRVQQFVAG